MNNPPRKVIERPRTVRNIIWVITTVFFVLWKTMRVMGYHGGWCECAEEAFYYALALALVVTLIVGFEF